MSRKNVTSYFSNLKVSAKLGIGFFITIAALVIMAMVTANCLETIQDNALRRAIAVDMVSSFGKVRLNRTLYQYTSEQQYADKNAQAVQELEQQYRHMADFKWQDEGKHVLDRVKNALDDYVLQRNALIEYMKKMLGQAEALQELPYMRVAKNLDALARRPDPGSDSVLQMLRLSSALKEAVVLVNAVTKHPQDENIQALIAVLDNAKNSVDLLNSPDIPEISSESMAARDIINQCLQMLEPYRTVWLEHGEAAAKLVKAGDNFSASVDSLFEYQKRLSASFVDSSKLRIGVVSLSGIIFSILLAWRITLSITQPLSKTLYMARRIADGDLSQVIISERKDEPGMLLQAVNMMSHNLKEIIINVRNGIGNVNTASAEIAAGNEDLSTRTEQQAAAVVQTAASVEELTSTVKLNSDNALNASRVAKEASEQASKGGNVVNGVVNTMENIRKSSARISEITSVINSIAFQTNILALNAAVEAARAGEQGRGFAVVAGEVRNLAQRSAVAAKEIEELIHESVSQVNEGAGQVDNAGKTMIEIINSVREVSEIMQEIATASEEQNRGISQISQAMAEMDTTTQQNAALVEESAAAANSLQEESGRLEKAIAVFNTGEGENVKSLSVARLKMPETLPAPTTGRHETHWQSF